MVKKNNSFSWEDELDFMINLIMGELKAIREELAAHSLSHERIQETLDDHESRIGSKN